MKLHHWTIGLVAACTTSRPSPPAPSGPVPDGGTIVLFAEPDGFGILAEVFATSTPNTVTIPTTGDGHCDVSPVDAALPQVTDQDLGATLVARDGSTTLTADASTTSMLGIAEGLLPQVMRLGSAYLYQAGVAGQQPFGTTWTIATTDATLATVEIPQAIQQQETTIVYTAGQAAVIHFSDVADADFVEIDLEGDAGEAVCYPSLGSTSFAAPASVLAAIAGNDSIGVSVFAKNRSIITLAGRQVVVSGQSQNLD